MITTAAAPLLSPLHDRMPVLLTKDAWSLWLAASESSVELLHELEHRDVSSELELYPVSRLVNDVRNDGPELIQALAASTLDAGLLTSFR